MILSIPRTFLGGGCCSATAAILVAALLIAGESGGGCSRPHSSSSANYGSCGSFFGIHVVGVDAFTQPTSRTTATPLHSSYLDSIAASVVPSKKKSHSPSSSSIGKGANAALANGADTPPPNFRSFSSSERTERKLRGTLGQLPIREDHLQSLVSDE